MYVSQSAEFYVSAGHVLIKAGGASLEMSAGQILLDDGAGAKVSLVGGLIALHSAQLMSSTGMQSLTASGPTFITSGGDMNAKAATIKLNG